MKIDVSTRADWNDPYPSAAFPVDGGAGTASMSDWAARLRPFAGERGPNVVVVQQGAPAGWNGGLTRTGFVQFAASDPAFTIGPGEIQGGFEIVSNRPPTIRKVVLVPWWVALFDDHNTATAEDREAAFEIEGSIPVESYLLGPHDLPVDTRFREDLLIGASLSWITDTQLLSDLLAKLDAAVAARDAGDGATAQTLFDDFVGLINAAAPSAATPEFRTLAVMNAQYLRAQVQTFITKPALFANPLRAVRPAGNDFIVDLLFVDTANNNEPIENRQFFARCAEGFACANFDADPPGIELVTNGDGEAELFFEAVNPGVDRIEIGEAEGSFFALWETVEVTWTAESDLIVPLFVPPLALVSSGGTVYLTDRTENIGTEDVTAETTTRYYISAVEPVDLETATVLGERVIPSLEGGEWNDRLEAPHVVPAGFGGEANYLAACADADDAVVEADESNNCSFTELGNAFQPVLVLDFSDPPSADAGGPYLVCTTEPLNLDGSGSIDPDEGTSGSGNPPFDTITAYEWDLDLASGDPFDVIGATGATPLVGAGLPAGNRQIGLRVTDNAAAAFGLDSNVMNQDTASTAIGSCGCIGPLTVRSKPTKNQLTWAPVSGASSYDIQRSTVGPNSGFSIIATGVVTSFATYLDSDLTNGVTYWYRVTPRNAQAEAVCDFSAAASGTP
jgi:hypothetical protein